MKERLDVLLVKHGLADTEILSLYLLLPVLQPALFQKKKMAL